MSHARAWLMCVVGPWVSSCTDANLYSQSGEEPLSPDRIALSGTLCAEDTSGPDFAVRVLYIIDTSQDMFRADADGRRFFGGLLSLETVINQNRNLPNVRFGFVGLAAAARAVPQPNGQRFFRGDDPEVAQALLALQAPAGTQRDVINALSQAESFITADMAQSTPGALLRTRYIVSMLLAGPPSPAASLATLASQAERLRELVETAGALEFRLHVGLVYLGPETIDQGASPNNCYLAGAPGGPPCPCAGGATGTAAYCDVYCDVAGGALTEQRNIDAREVYQSIAFTGGGTFREFPCPIDIDLGVEVGSGGINLVAKDIVAFNRNVLLTSNGQRVDSDGDGLADVDEGRASPPTDPHSRDSDGDGLGDTVESRAYPEQDPTNRTDRPAACLDPAVFGSIPDRDFDLLNDCEEGLLQTSPTVPDTDGDGLPDALEFWSGTVPTSADDRLLDFDADGVGNADEVVAHTPPRANDAAHRSREAYRTRVVPLGLRTVASMPSVPELPGVIFRSATANAVGGQALLRWTAATRNLEWSDARATAIPPFNPVPVTIEGDGIYALTARSPNGEVVSAELQVFDTLMPASDVTVFPLLSVAERNCYDVRISNIKLKITEPANGESRRGENRILVFFTQGPEHRLHAPGIAKVAELRVLFDCGDEGDVDTCARDPDGVLPLADSDFVSAVP